MLISVIVYLMKPVMGETLHRIVNQEVTLLVCSIVPRKYHLHIPCLLVEGDPCSGPLPG